MQLMMNAHKEPNDENQEDKEHDKEFKEVYKGVTKRGKISDGSRKSEKGRFYIKKYKIYMTIILQEWMQK